MFNPQYKRSDKLINTITQIERLYGQIEALRVPKKLQLNLRRDNLIQSAYASNRIEGNPLTLPEVTNLLLDDRIPTNRDEKEVVNYFDILTRLPQLTDQPLDIKLVTDIHRQLVTGVYDNIAGQIRNEKVVIGKYTGEQGNVSLKVKHEPPHHDKHHIQASLTELLDWANQAKPVPAIILTGIFHHHFVYIHPFEDGNGRVCRLLTALLFIKHGYQINKYFVLDDYYDIDRTQYSDALHSADKGDKTAWLEYFAQGVKYSLTSALSRLETATKTLAYAERPTNKEAQVIEYLQTHREITSTDLANHLNVSRQQAHNLLKSLVDKDLVIRKGSTKSSYYLLK